MRLLLLRAAVGVAGGAEGDVIIDSELLALPDADSDGECDVDSDADAVYDGDAVGVVERELENDSDADGESEGRGDGDRGMRRRHVMPGTTSCMVNAGSGSSSATTALFRARARIASKLISPLQS